MSAHQKSIKTQSTLPLLFYPKQLSQVKSVSKSYDQIAKQQSTDVHFRSKSNKRYDPSKRQNTQLQPTINQDKYAKISKVNRIVTLTENTQPQNKKIRIQQIYMAKNKPFRRHREKDTIDARKKAAQIQIIQLEHKRQQPIQLHTISQEQSKKLIKEYQMDEQQTFQQFQQSTKKEVYQTLTHLKQHSFQSLENESYSKGKFHHILEQNDHNWMKNNYHPHLDILKQVDRDTLSFQKYTNAVYYGQLNQENKKHGLGIIFYKSGKLFEGEFKNDIKSGEGYELYPDGSFYIGEFNNGQKEGKGRYEWINGQIYDGQWLEGKKHGSGLWQSKSGNSSYIGQWRNGQIEGFGVLLDEKGCRYEGQFYKSMKHGKGTLRQPNGQTYIGQFRKNIPNGQGEYYWSSGDHYKGQFSNGMRHGTGTQIFSDGSLYKGQFRNDKKSGYGQQKFLDGISYIGNFQNNYRHGYGQLYCQNNAIYKGYWVNNKSVQFNQTPIILEDEKEALSSMMGMRSKQQLLKKQIPKKQISKNNINKKIISKSSTKDLLKNKLQLEKQKSSHSLEKDQKRGCRCHRKH